MVKFRDIILFSICRKDRTNSNSSCKPFFEGKDGEEKMLKFILNMVLLFISEIYMGIRLGSVPNKLYIPAPLQICFKFGLLINA